MSNLTKVIHQIWLSNIEPNNFLKYLSQTWKNKNPDWEYIYWNIEKTDKFLNEYYPEYIIFYNNLKYIDQKSDFIKYLILYKYGGLVINLNYACIKSINDLINNTFCLFAKEPYLHAQYLHITDMVYVSNSFIYSECKNIFLFELINGVIINLKNKFDIEYDINDYESGKSYSRHILRSTGSIFVSNLFEHYFDKNKIKIIEPELVMPMNVEEVNNYTLKKSLGDFINLNVKLSKYYNNSYAINYFFD
jgi:mannosyltransferase OCH1-like enzyme